MNTPHTPGPWTLSLETDVYAPGQDGKIFVAECDCSNFIPYAQKIANAQLIASAPTLLSQRNELRAALQRLLTCYESHFPVGSELTQARAALASIKD